MSRGLGAIERALIDVIRREPDNAFITEDLCRIVYDRGAKPLKKHRVSVLRAMQSVASKIYEIAVFSSSYLPGARLAIYNRVSAKSYGMAYLKCDPFYRYKYYRYYGLTKPEAIDRQQANRAKREAFLSALLEPGGAYHSNIVPGGAWAFEADLTALELSGDAAGAAALLAKRQVDFEKWLASCPLSSPPNATEGPSS